MGNKAEVIYFRTTKNLKQWIEEQAKKENRPVSNWLNNHFIKMRNNEKEGER